VAGAGAGASFPPPNKDEKNPLDSGAGAVVVAVVAAAGLLTGAGAGAGGNGGAAFVDTLMDGLNANEGSVVSFLLSKSERSVVSFNRLVTPFGMDGLGGANEEDDGGVGGEMDGRDGSDGNDGNVSNNDGDAVRWIEIGDIVEATGGAVDKGSDRVLVWSTNIFKSSIGTVRSGGAPPICAVLSWVISILLTDVLPVAVEDNGVVVNAPPPPLIDEGDLPKDFPTCTVFIVDGDSGPESWSSLSPEIGDGGADIL